MLSLEHASSTHSGFFTSRFGRSCGTILHVKARRRVKHEALQKGQSMSDSPFARMRKLLGIARHLSTLNRCCSATFNAIVGMRWIEKAGIQCNGALRNPA
ncbi:hypothetical protein BAUCODRAFT_275423 [Baudoinia panamericana UAMH 10762]|uniref:Uncharacterized protein n=1 Tax=Baudoinia panamericana (strain UAMH 10762) TaxID=717646 RepID=M2N0F2_BAUPA|nr:uncharacterized protein BAUCODRAFT_275423 [Baudoinia panamericana UAMH 10762]EMC92070.1 hypothetical protein BAUCODRAFT_275423 [Baudoinia panamericana UAMH 10762]